MDLESLITSFKKRKLDAKVSQGEIDKTLFIAYNVSLAKTFQDLEKTVSKEHIVELVEKIKNSQKKEDWESVESIVTESLGDNFTDGVLGSFAQNMEVFLSQL